VEQQYDADFLAAEYRLHLGVEDSRGIAGNGQRFEGRIEADQRNFGRRKERYGEKYREPHARPPSEESR